MAQAEELRQLAVDQVRSGFPVGDPPLPDVARNDHCLECAETSEIFLGRRWTDITVADLLGNPSPYLLNEVAFRYYLPAMMTCSLDAPDELDCFPQELIGVLSPSRGKTNDRDARRLASFSRDQIQAILAFLRFFQARQRKDEWAGFGLPPEVVEELPTDRVLERAIEYWAQKLSLVSS